jgi:hypothetical protein
MFSKNEASRNLQCQLPWYVGRLFNVQADLIVIKFGREKELEVIGNVSKCHFSLSINSAGLDYHRVRNVSTSFSRHFSATKGHIALSASGSGSTVNLEDGAQSVSSQSESSHTLPNK